MSWYKELLEEPGKTVLVLSERFWAYRSEISSKPPVSGQRCRMFQRLLWPMLSLSFMQNTFRSWGCLIELISVYPACSHYGAETKKMINFSKCRWLLHTPLPSSCVEGDLLRKKDTIHQPVSGLYLKPAVTWWMQMNIIRTLKSVNLDSLASLLKNDDISLTSYYKWPVLGKVTFKSNALQYCVIP